MDTFKLSNSQPMCAIKYQISSRGHLHYIKRYMILFVRRRQIFIMSAIQCHHVLSGPHYFMVCSSQVQCVRIGVQTSFPRQHEHTDVTWQASLEVCYSLAPMLRNLLYQIVLYFSGSMNLSELTAIDLSANQMSCDFGQSFKAQPKRVCKTHSISWLN